MSDFFGFTERYLSADGKEYIDGACVREALGIVDEHVDVFGVIKKLKQERDEFKEKCDKLKKRANAVYGTSCGYSEYSGDKAPAFLCNVISYSWSFGAIDTPFPNNSIRVELNLTPTANYKGTFDLEDLKRYIQAYGREKKLSDFEVFCKLVNNCIDELCDKYTVVKPDRNRTTRERLDYIFGVLDEHAERCDELDDFRADICEVLDIDTDELFGSPQQNDKYVLEQVKKLKESAGHDKLFRDSVCDALDTTTAVSDSYLFKTIEKLKLDHKEIQEKHSRYCLAVGSLLGIPNEAREDINAIERSFTFSKKQYKSLQKFRDDVCEIFDIPSNMADNYILKEIHDVADRYDELEDFRADICGALDIEGMLGTPKQNDKYILEQVENLNDECDDLIVFRNDVAKAVCSNPNDSNADILKTVGAVMERATELQFNTVDKDDVVQPTHSKTTRYKSLQEFRDSVYKELGLNRYGCTLTETIDELKKRLDHNARFRSDVCIALGLSCETSDEDILKRVRMTSDCHDALCKDYTELKHGNELLIEFRDDVAKAIGMGYPTTNQVILQNVKYLYKDRGDAYEIVSKLNDQVTALEKAKEDLQQMLIASQKQVKGWTNRCDSLEDQGRDLSELRKNAIEELKSRGFCFRPEEDETLPEIYDKLLKRYDWAYGEYKEQYRLRQAWYARWGSENERANGEHKRAEKLRKDVTALSNHIELLKLSNASQANSVVASQAFKNECRKLKEEKAKVIAALGQDIWDDCVK